jgi:hypothetical protein
MLIENLAISAGMGAALILIHFFGLAGLLALLRPVAARDLHSRSFIHGGATILGVIFGLVGLHTVEIWLYAFLFLGLGEFGTLEAAVYYSTTSFSTLGYGDLTLSEGRRLLGAIEGAQGFLLIGWSTAFLVAVIGRMGLLEAQMERFNRNRPPRENEPS